MAAKPWKCASQIKFGTKSFCLMLSASVAGCWQMVLIGPQPGPASVFYLCVSVWESVVCVYWIEAAAETTYLGEINCLFANKAINGPFIGHRPIYIAEEVLRRRQINVRPSLPILLHFFIQHPLIVSLCQASVILYPRIFISLLRNSCIFTLPCRTFADAACDAQYNKKYHCIRTRAFWVQFCS